jgi:hypothetical protein
MSTGIGTDEKLQMCEEILSTVDLSSVDGDTRSEFSEDLPSETKKKKKKKQQKHLVSSVSRSALGGKHKFYGDSDLKDGVKKLGCTKHGPRCICSPFNFGNMKAGKAKQGKARKMKQQVQDSLEISSARVRMKRAHKMELGSDDDTGDNYTDGDDDDDDGGGGGGGGGGDDGHVCAADKSREHPDRQAAEESNINEENPIHITPQSQSHKTEVSVGADDVRSRFLAFYMKFNPTKLADVDKNLLKYKGREDLLFVNLRKKYRVTEEEAEAGIAENIQMVQELGIEIDGNPLLEPVKFRTKRQQKKAALKKAQKELEPEAAEVDSVNDVKKLMIDLSKNKTQIKVEKATGDGNKKRSKRAVKAKMAMNVKLEKGDTSAEEDEEDEDSESTDTNSHLHLNRHLLNPKERKKYVKQLNRGLTDRGLPPLGPDEVEELFAAPSQGSEGKQGQEDGAGEQGQEQEEQQEPEVLEVEDGLWMLSGKERKRYVKKMNKKLAAQGLPSLEDDEIEAMFARPDENEEHESGESEDDEEEAA